MTSEIRTNIIKNRVGLGTISLTNTGLVVSGIITATNFVGSLPISNDGANRVLTSDGDGTATAHSFITIESNRLSINRGSGSGAYPLIVRRTDASGVIAEFANNGGYGLWIGQNSATGEAYLRTGTGQALVFTTNSGSGITNERLRITSDGDVLINQPPGGATGRLVIRGAGAYAVTNSGKALEGIDINVPTVGDGNYGGAISFTTGGNGRSAIAAVQDGSDDDKNGLAFFTHSSTTGSDNNSERLRINSTGGLKLSNTSSGSLFEYGGSTVQSHAAINISRSGNGYADIRLSSNYGASLRLAGAANNTDEFNITQDNQKIAYITNEADQAINFSAGGTQVGKFNGSQGVFEVVSGDITAGYHHGNGMYGLLAKRKFRGGDALGGYAIRYASGYESPWIVGYNAGSSYDNQITFGSMTTSDRNLATGVQKRMVIDMQSGYVGISESDPQRDLHISDSTVGGIIRLTNTSTSISNGTICGMIEFEQRDSNTPGVSANIRAEMQDTTNGANSLNFSTGTPSTIGTRLILDSNGNLQIRGTNHATMYYRDDGNRYGSIFYDGSNFVTRMPAGDNYQVELLDGTVHTRFNNVNGQSGSGRYVEFYGGDNTYMWIRGGTQTKPSIYLEGGSYGVDNSRIGAKYNLALACNEDGNQADRGIDFYNDDVRLARLSEDNAGTSSAQGCLYTTGPGAIRDYYDMRNINLDANGFDAIGNDSDGGGTFWEIKGGSIIRLYSTSGGHGGTWGKPVYIREAGYYYWRCNFRVTTTCGAIHNNTSVNNYQYPIMFRFRMDNSGAGSQCKVEHNQHYSTTGTCNGSDPGGGTLADGTRVTRTGDAVYLSPGNYQPRYFTSGYSGVRELHIYELALIQCGSGNSGA